MSERGGLRGSGLLAIGVFTAAWLAAIVALQVVLVIAIVLVEVDLDRGDLVSQLMRLADPAALPTWSLAATLVVQFPLMIGLAVGVWALERRVRAAREVETEPLREALGLRSASAAVVAVGGLMGLTTGWLPGWIAGVLREAFPWIDFGGLALLERAMTEGSLFVRATVVAGVVVGAPVVEELVFRGVIWRWFERAGGWWMAWLGSSLLFAAYHMDPIQATALLFTALVIGWLRAWTGSVWPGIALHFVNNGLGMLGSIGIVPESDVSLGAALLGAVVSVAACAAIAVRARP